MNPLRSQMLAIALVLITSLARAEPFDFALIGDVPYSDFERRELPKMLEAIGAENIAFVVHDGDIKNGSSLCSDALFQDRLAVFQASPLPLIFVPRDNEWTDCHRANNGSYNPVERLAKLRDIFFPAARTLGKAPFALDTPRDAFAEYREHQRWTRGGVMFVTLNVPGSDNNFLPPPNTEYLARSRAVSAWLAESFAAARKQKLKGLVVVVQADPEFEKPPRGYRDFLDQLARESVAFKGQVLFVHGDSHRYTLDQPLKDGTGRVIQNFTRLETFGYPFMGWVRVRVDASLPRLFEIQPQPWMPASND